MGSVFAQKWITESFLQLNTIMFQVCILIVVQNFKYSLKLGNSLLKPKYSEFVTK